MEAHFWTIGIFLVSQTAVAIWWAANLSSDVRYMKRKLEDLERDFDRAYSARDGNRLEARLEKLELAHSVHFSDRN